MAESSGHEAGHGVRLAGPGGAVREDSSGDALQGVTHERRTHRFVYFFLVRVDIDFDSKFLVKVRNVEWSQSGLYRFMN